MISIWQQGIGWEVKKLVYSDNYYKNEWKFRFINGVIENSDQK